MRLSPELLLAAYSQGVFPMGEHDGSISWYDPNPRALIPLDERFHVPRSLARRIRQGGFEIHVDRDFRQTMRACAEPAPGRETTWITDEFVDVYSLLNQMGFAHSVETWIDGELVGGLYGVALGGLFAGESMFSRQSDASKIALVYLVERLRTRGFVLLDTQFTTNHLCRFGTYEISRAEYKRRLKLAMGVDASFV
ncbi:MAG: leucyl/phenylalanyl-tRNA--protein transferase [Caldilineaceae bacterium]